MDWNKAKNIMILFLFLLNLVLGFLMFQDSKKYKLSTTEEINITNILKQNKISIYTEIIKKFTPMKKINMEKYEFDTSALVKVFFKDTKSIERNENDGMTIFNNDTGTLTIRSEEYVYFESNDTEKIINPVENFNQQAKELCDDIMKKLGKDFKQFKMDTEFSNLEIGNSFYSKDGLFIYYKEKFNNYTLNCNYVRFVVNENGVKEVMIENYKPIGFINQTTREICSPDEALFTLMQYIKINEEEKQFFINKMDLVYDLEEEATDKKSIYAVPYYRFYIKGSEIPYRVNAFFNKVLK